MPLLQVLHTQLLVDATLGKGQKLGSPSRAQPSVLLTIMMDATPLEYQVDLYDSVQYKLNWNWHDGLNKSK